MFDWEKATPQEQADAVNRARQHVPDWDFGWPWPPGAGPFEPVDAPGEAFGVDLELRGMAVDWPTFWTAEQNDAEWLYEPVVARGRGHALFALSGTGKSLLALNIATIVALAGHRVLYVDYEMTADDLMERLEAMGHGPATDLANLVYFLNPGLPPADSLLGGTRIVRAADLFDVELVVLDTFARAVDGDENDADTLRSFVRHTGSPLKAAGRAFLRIDHAGKVLERGQRGSSAKNDDVDVVWEMARHEYGVFRLTARKRRMGWVPEHVDLRLDAEAATFTVAMDPLGAWPAGTAEAVEELDLLGVPLDWGRPKVARMLRDKGHRMRNQTISAALKYRRLRLENLPGTAPPQGSAGACPNDDRSTPDTSEKPQASDTGQASGAGGDMPSTVVVGGGVTPVGSHPIHDPPPEPDDEPDEGSLW